MRKTLENKLKSEKIKEKSRLFKKNFHVEDCLGLSVEVILYKNC